MAHSLDHLICQWLRQLKIPVSKTFITNKILSHPDYPSLLSVTDVLDDMEIENAALVVDKERLHEIPTPFLAHTGVRGGEFVLIKNLNKHLKSDPDFEKNWDGTAVVAEKPLTIAIRRKNKENEKYLAEERRNKIFRWLAVSTILLLTAFSLSNQFTWQNLGLLLTTLAGLAVAILIVQHELGIRNPVTEQLCAAGKNTDCDAVMKSKGSKLLKWLNWADAGIIYFSSLFLLLTISFFTGTAQSQINILALLATCSLPFTLLSVYYQWQVVKKWCPLCLVAVAVLWLQFFLTLSLTEGHFLDFSFNTILFAAFLFTANVILWLGLIKPTLQKNKELPDKNFSLLRFKNNPDIFKAFLQQQRRVDVTAFENDLQLGNPNAHLQIMIVSNPFCGPCAKAHEILHDLVRKKDVGLTVRFNIRNKHKDEKSTQAVDYILKLIADKNNNYQREVLQAWFRMMDIEKFQKKYPLEKEINVEAQLSNHSQWTKEWEIIFTPTFFINGNKLPVAYNILDLVAFVNNLSVKGEQNKIAEPINQCFAV